MRADEEEAEEDLNDAAQYEEEEHDDEQQLDNDAAQNEEEEHDDEQELDDDAAQYEEEEYNDDAGFDDDEDDQDAAEFEQEQEEYMNDALAAVESPLKDFPAPQGTTYTPATIDLSLSTLAAFLLVGTLFNTVGVLVLCYRNQKQTEIAKF